MAYQLKTINGYDFYEVSSSLQKAIRRNDIKLAGYFGLELFASGFYKYVWKRLFTISAEDCYGTITFEIQALYEGFNLINKGNKKHDKGRIFISKAIILLCKSTKSRDADHLQNFIYDKRSGINDLEIKTFFKQVTEKQITDLMDEIRKEPKLIPDYAFDVHTKKGKLSGKTKKDFFKEEQEALKPTQLSIWDLSDLI